MGGGPGLEVMLQSAREQTIAQGPLSPLRGLGELGHAANMVNWIYCQALHINRLKQST